MIDQHADFGENHCARPAPVSRSNAKAPVKRATAKTLGSEIVRLVSMRYVLRPAAVVLPKSWLLGLANALSWVLCVATRAGRNSYWEIRAAFGLGRIASLKLARRRLAQPLSSYAVFRRVIEGRERPSDWKVEHRNREYVQQLLDSGESFMLASGHFTRHAYLGVPSLPVEPGRWVQVGLPGHDGIRSMQELRRRLADSTLARIVLDQRNKVQYDALLEALPVAWPEKIEFGFVHREFSAAQQIYKRLLKPGTVVSIHVDAPWQQKGPGTYVRPFAGEAHRAFSTGAAQLAKLTKRPIIFCSYWIESDGTVVIEWSPPITGVDDEKATMDTLIDSLEVAVGRRPEHYTLDIGAARRWNAKLQTWQS